MHEFEKLFSSVAGSLRPFGIVAVCTRPLRRRTCQIASDRNIRSKSAKGIFKYTTSPPPRPDRQIEEKVYLPIYLVRKNINFNLKPTDRRYVLPPLSTHTHTHPSFNLHQIAINILKPTTSYSSYLQANFQNMFNIFRSFDFLKNRCEFSMVRNL